MHGQSHYLYKASCARAQTKLFKSPAQTKWPSLDKGLVRHFMAVEGWGRGGGQEACTKHQTAKKSVFFSYSSTREQSNKRSGTRLKHGRVRLTCFARTRLLCHALPISLLILRKKPTVLQSNQTLDSLARSVCDRTVSYLVIS